LALLKAVERIIKLYDPLRTYFLSEMVVPNVLRSFFSNEEAPLYLEFIHNQAVIFHDSILKLEKQSMPAMQASKILNELKDQLSYRLDNVFIPLIIRSKRRALEESEPGLRKKFEKKCEKFL
jgi:hypothetical protein